jgi:phage FluMu protein Com
MDRLLRVLCPGVTRTGYPCKRLLCVASASSVVEVKCDRCDKVVRLNADRR